MDGTLLLIYLCGSRNRFKHLGYSFSLSICTYIPIIKFNHKKEITYLTSRKNFRPLEGLFLSKMVTELDTLKRRKNSFYQKKPYYCHNGIIFVPKKNLNPTTNKKKINK